jgi:hypothetical protein
MNISNTVTTCLLLDIPASKCLVNSCLHFVITLL